MCQQYFKIVIHSHKGMWNIHINELKAPFFVKPVETVRTIQKTYMNQFAHAWVIRGLLFHPIVLWLVEFLSEGESERHLHVWKVRAGIWRSSPKPWRWLWPWSLFFEVEVCHTQRKVVVSARRRFWEMFHEYAVRRDREMHGCSAEIRMRVYLQGSHLPVQWNGEERQGCLSLADKVDGCVESWRAVWVTPLGPAMWQAVISQSDWDDPKKLERTCNHSMLKGRVRLSMRLLTKHCVKEFSTQGKKRMAT